VAPACWYDGGRIDEKNAMPSVQQDQQEQEREEGGGGGRRPASPPSRAAKSSCGRHPARRVPAHDEHRSQTL
jgi:hypothetical protein